MQSCLGSETIIKKAKKLRSDHTSDTQPFNSYAYLMKNSSKVSMVNLPVNLTDALFVWILNGKKLILINESANISIEGLNWLLCLEVAKLELGEQITPDEACLFAKTLLFPDAHEDLSAQAILKRFEISIDG